MYTQKIEQIRRHLRESGAAGIVLSTQDNILYSTGFSSVMDGWHLIEPLAAVFVPTDPARPIVLMLPEASLISLIVSQRAGYPIHFDRIGTFDLLNFCETARAQDAHLSLPEDLLEDLSTLSEQVEGPCAPDVIQAIAASVERHVGQGESVLFDDLRVAGRVAELTGRHAGDGLNVILNSRAIKTTEELDLFRRSGRIADDIMAFTVGQLGIGVSWAAVEKAVAKHMIDLDVDPLPGSPMLFGGAYDLVFRPDLFRTPFSTPFKGGEIAILETQGKYQGIWIDINRTAHIGTPSQAYREQFSAVQETFQVLSERLRPGVNTAEICEIGDIAAARRLDPPDKLLVVAHSVGLIPLESPVAYPGTGSHGAKQGFIAEPNMVISIDCLYFGSRLGPSHMENVFIVTENGAEALYQYPLDLAEVV